MERLSGEPKSDCMNHCDDKFTRCSSRQSVGCVEALRICRESCRLSASS